MIESGSRKGNLLKGYAFRPSVKTSEVVKERIGGDAGG